MNDKSKLVLWSPHFPDRFVVGSNNLRLYQTITVTGVQPQNVPVEPPMVSSPRSNATEYEKGITATSTSTLPRPSQPTTTTTSITRSAISTAPLTIHDGADVPMTITKQFKLLDTVTYQQQSVKCLAWGLDRSDPLLLSAGLLSGRLVLLRFLDDVKVVKEFIPRYARACNVIAWNPHSPNQIAVGLDRVRNGCGTLIWDIHQRGAIQGSTEQATPSPFPSLPTTSFSINANRATESVTDAIGRVSNSEATLALAWLPNDAFSLAVGTGFKWLRIYDIRGNSRPLSVVAHTKSVQGVKFDPFCPSRLATFSEDGIVKLWDMRQLRGPVMTVITSKQRGARPTPLLEVEWCPTRPGLMGTISKDEDVLRLWDLSGSLSSLDDPTITPLPTGSIDVGENLPCRKHQAAGALTSLSWHPTIKQRLLTVTLNGVVEDISLHDNVPVAWTAQNTFSFGVNENMYLGGNLTNMSEFDSINNDIAAVMKQRAEMGYALDVSVNHTIAQRLGSTELQRLWSWMNHCDSLYQDRLKTESTSDTEGIRSGARTPTTPSSTTSNSSSSTSTSPSTSTRFPGILSLLLPNRDITRDDISDDEKYNLHSTLVDTSTCLPSSFRVFSSPQRSAALRICGWWDTFTSSSTDEPPSSRTQPSKKRLRTPEQNSLEQVLTQLENQGEYEQSAALALFHLDLRRALEALTLGADRAARNTSTPTRSSPDLGLVAMALSGFSAQLSHAQSTSDSLWQQMWSSTLQHHSMSPYLRAAFSFLATNGPAKPTVQTYKTVLEDSGIDLRQRCAFACRFLPDTDLIAYIERQAAITIEHGDLDGLLLTGLASRDAHDLIQAYVDRTADIQTASILASYAQSILLTSTPNAESIVLDPDSRHNRWITLYKQLLNQWKLWTQRAKLDVARSLLLLSENSGISAATIGTLTAAPIPSRTGAVAPSSSTTKSTKRAAVLNLRPQVSARCNYCGQVLSLDGMGTAKGQTRNNAFRPRQANVPSATTRTKGCPSCKKPLPRCALCLLSLDVTTPDPTAALHKHRRGEDDPRWDVNSMNEFGRWFTWCQACRHGGHAKHIQEWFHSHSECPVTDCQCRCMSLDMIPDDTITNKMMNLTITNAPTSTSTSASTSTSTTSAIPTTNGIIMNPTSPSVMVQ